MGLHDLGCNGEANTLTAGIPIARLRDTIKRFKYTLQVACRHARAAIAYDDPQRPGLPAGLSSLPDVQLAAIGIVKI